MPRASELNPATIAAYRQAFGIDAIAAIATSGLTFVGAWAANGAAPTPTANGQYWIVSVAGTTNLGGISSWEVGDWAIHKGAGVWVKVPNPAQGIVADLASTAAGKGGEMVAFKQSGTGAVARTVQLKLRERISVSDFGAVGDGVTDDTTALTNAVAAAAGRVLHFDKPGTEYLTGRLILPSNVTLWFEPGVKLRKKANGLNILNFTNVENVVVHGNGVWLYGDDLPGASSFSHTVIFQGAKKCVLRNVNIDGASAGKDCIYIGKGVAASEDIRIEGGKCLNAKRNGISVVSAKRTIIDGVECAYATGAPGAGIDIEANLYDECVDTVVKNCHLHHNQSGGLFSIFGPRTTLDNNEIHDNGTYGIGVSSGGTEFNDGVYRPNIDVIGVSAFNTGTGVITVGAALRNLPIGTPVNFSTRNGAVKPAEYSASYYIVSRHVGSDGVVLGLAVGQGEITTLASAGTGTRSNDPAVSDIRLRAFVAGQSDDYVIRRNKIYANATQGIALLAGSGRHLVEGNTIWDNGGNQVQAQSCYSVRIQGNQIFQTPAATANVAGIACGSGGGALEIIGNWIQNTRGKGISVTQWTGARIERNDVWNCAFADAASDKAGISLLSIMRAYCIGNRVYQTDGNTTTLYGIYADGTATNCTFRENDCTGSGTTNANSLVLTSSTNTVQDNVQRDGTKHLTGSTTYDPPSIANGSSAYTAVAVTGCSPGDFAEASFSANLNGVVISAQALNGAVGVRFLNNSGAAVDLASGTLKVRVRR